VVGPRPRIAASDVATLKVGWSQIRLSDGVFSTRGPYGEMDVDRSQRGVLIEGPAANAQCLGVGRRDGVHDSDRHATEPLAADTHIGPPPPGGTSSPPHPAASGHREDVGAVGLIDCC
jgi:hypothetical protein